MSSLSPEQEILVSFYEATRNEIVARLRLRDTFLASYTVAVAATIGFSKAALGEPHTEALYILPYLALAFTMLVCYHHFAVATLGMYLKQELWPQLKTTGAIAPMFEVSASYLQHRSGAWRLRAAGQLVVLLSPPVFCLIVNFHDASQSLPPRTLYWWFGLVAIALSGYVVNKAYRFPQSPQSDG